MMDSYDIFRKLSFGAKFIGSKQKVHKPQTSLIKKESSSTDVPNKLSLTEVNVSQINGSGSNSIKTENSDDASSMSYSTTHIGNNSFINQNYDAELTNNLKLLGDINTSNLGPPIQIDEQEVKEEPKGFGEPEAVVPEKGPTARLLKETIARVRNRYHISVIGRRIPPPVEHFSDLQVKYNLSKQIIKNLHYFNCIEPTPIQMQTIPLLMENRQVLACAPTGSGKTIAFLLPIIHQLKSPANISFRAVIVCPTRELAAQIFRACELITQNTGLKTCVISHVKHSYTASALMKFDILIATPNRLVFMLQQDEPVITLKNVEWLIVDECDKLFEGGIRGFRNQLAVIYLACDSPKVKRAMFSATQVPYLTKWCIKKLKNCASVTVGVRNTASNIVNQELLFVGNEAGKLIAFRDIIRKGVTPPVLVFVQTKERAQELFTELIYDGINVDVIHADRTQTQRDNVVRSFREGKIWVLICTELMGRGIDFKGVNLVVNYDFPLSAVSYIHRIGRTGRAGRPGRAVTYFTTDDNVNLRSIAQVLKDSGCEVPEYMLTLKRPNKADKKQLAKKAPHRENITVQPVNPKILTKRKKQKKSEDNLPNKKQKINKEHE